MKSTLTFLLSLYLLSAAAQKQITHQRLHWSQFKFVVSIDSASKWKYDLNVQDRRYIFPNRRHQLFVKNSVSYSPSKKWTSTLGLLYFEITQPQDPFENNFSLQMPEIRPTFAVTNKSFYKNWTYSHRVMAELRILGNFDENYELTGDWRHNYRVRWRNEISRKITSFKQGTHVSLYNEIMFNFGENIVFNTFDQNRLGFVIKQKWTTKFATNAGFFNWFQQTGAGNRYFSRYISRIGFIYSI